ncbi:MAG TPA: hypothetical protein VFS85_05555 [Dongiaceae bacterium]|nr:hypothetical protein [Dongiaceae bacterium]HSE75441.1 hypothetical protein [Dongiaceae bacterium]
MASLAAILRELWSLFVDDGRLALALVIWVALGGIGLPLSPIPPAWDAPALFVGCVVILVFNVMRSMRRKRPG